MRTEKILSRVFRNLERNGYKIDDILDEEIYDEMQVAQDRIITEIFPDKIITITLETDVDEYPLTTDSSSEDNPDKIITIEDNPKKNIASVKIIELPSGWKGVIDDYGNKVIPADFQVVTNEEFINAVNATPSLSGRPRIATIIDNQLKLYPKPTSDDNGKVLKLYTYLSSSAGSIDKDNEPEVPGYCDDALEKYATAQFLEGDMRAQYLKEFEREVIRIRPIQNRKHHNLSRAPITGW